MLLAVGVAVLFALPAYVPRAPGTIPSPRVGSASPSALPSIRELASEGRAQAPYAMPTRPSTEIGAYSGPLTVLVTFKLSNQTELSNYLSELVRSGSPVYHQYIDRATFAARYGAPTSVYSSAAEYFGTFPGVTVTPAADRVSIELTGSASAVGTVFDTPVALYPRTTGGNFYAAARTPTLPESLATDVAAVTGLDNFTLAQVASGYRAFTEGRTVQPTGPPATVDGYLAPVNITGYGQLEFAPDLQVAYDEQGLLSLTYASNETIATVLWAGEAINGSLVAPFDPTDITDFFNETLPSWEPHAQVAGVPIDGAPAPGPDAQYDVTDTELEDDIDLEMSGSMAPGAHIYNVYGKGYTQSDLDAVFDFILNPNSSASGLDNVSVISNSWGIGDTNDTTWYTYLEEAQARGITVLACSGDSDDTVQSPYYRGGPPNDWPWSPASMAYDDFGDIAVGGTQVLLSSDLGLENQSVWNDTVNVVGSTGGPSHIIAEPDFQADSLANALIRGVGRGAPDISAMANNTLITMTVDGYQYTALNASYDEPFAEVWGTSIATPLMAGVVAEIDAVLASQGAAPVGYLDPQLYALGDAQYSPTVSNATVGVAPSGPYNDTLPALPFDDVTEGGNEVYSALPGYDLATGWGSIDAYNLTIYLDNANFSTDPEAIGGVQNTFDLTGANVTSYFGYGSINPYNATVQQNFFLANALGAPLYWIQNVIYAINVSNGWVMEYTGWCVYPFYGQYPYDALYAYNTPASYYYVTTPQNFTIASWLTSNGSFLGGVMHFQVNGQLIELPVPGAAYAIGSYAYSYEWQGQEVTNGPYPDNPAPGGLAPQFAFVGGGGGSIGVFGPGTNGTLASAYDPLDLSGWVPADSTVLEENYDQTGESAYGLNWSRQPDGNWTMRYVPDDFDQGVVFYAAPEYALTFEESGLAAGSAWSVSVNGTVGSSTTDLITSELGNGGYGYVVGHIDGFLITHGNGTATVAGAPQTIFVAFRPEPYTVEFLEQGLPNGSTWYVDVDGSNLTSDTSNITFSLLDGSYGFVDGGPSPYGASPGRGDLTVDFAGLTINVTFFESFYRVSVFEDGLPAGTSWVAEVNGDTQSTTGFVVNYAELNGSYPVTLGPVPGYEDRFSGPSVANVSGGNVTVDVLFLVTPRIVAFTAQPAVVDVGQATSIAVGATGGLGPYSFAYSGLPTGCASGDVASFLCTPQAAGTYSITVVVRDLLNGTVSATTSLTVRVAPGTGTTSSPPMYGAEEIGLVLAAVAIAAVVGVLLLRRRRGRPERPSGVPAQPPTRP